MIYLEVLVEELSCEAALAILLPKIAPDLTFKIRTFQGKTDLLKNLPSRLRAAAKYLGPNGRLLVVVDRDDDDCLVLKRRLDTISSTAGLRGRPRGRKAEPIQVLSRIAVEELEAWFFGDTLALRRAFPGVPETLADRAPFRDPDAITGGTAERLGRVLRDAGHYPAGLAKIDAARRIANEMDPASNRSRSFNCFRQGVLELMSASE